MIKIRNQPCLSSDSFKLHAVLPDGCHLNLLNRVTKKLLDRAKHHVTNFLLKIMKFCLKNYSFSGFQNKLPLQSCVK